MPSFVVKVAPDADEYVVWSTVTDSPHAWGTAAEITEWLVETGREKPEYARPEIEQRMGRADNTGTSSMAGRAFGWAAAGFVYEGRAWLPRARLSAFLATFDSDAETFDESLLEPIEDGARA